VFKFVPTFTPFTTHWNVGVGAPFTGAPMKVTDDPKQKGLDGVEMVMLTGNNGLTDTGYWILDAGLFVVHNSEDINVQETKSPLSGM